MICVKEGGNMFANINDTKIYYDVEGAGVEIKNDEIITKEPCFVLHGGPGSNHLSFKGNLTALTKYFQLIYVDNRGSGFSAKSDKELYTIEQNVEDIEELRKTLGLEKVSLLGHSYGGMVALKYAVTYPEHTKSLILITTSPHGSFIQDAQVELRNRGTKEQNEISEYLWSGSFENEEQHISFQKLLAPLYSLNYRPENADKPRKGDFSFDALNMGFGGFLKEYDVTEDITTLDIPALVIGANHDWITPVKHSYWIHELMKNSDLVILENSSHSVFSDAKEEVIHEMLTFIQKRVMKS